ncbi:MAG TPA: helix-turn-helix domain-containing protein [Solirubrobacterales bacterium]
MTPRKGEAPAPAIQSVQRAARLLTLFTVDEPELSLRQITAGMGMSKATAHRYATALRDAGLLRLSRGLYSLGPRIVELAPVALAGLAVVELAGPYMRELVSETEQTAVLSVWDGEAPIVVRVDENTGRIVRIVVATGSRLPLDSAQGRVFSAFVADAPDPPEAAEVRAERIASNAQVVEGISALAVPIFQGEEIVATLALVGTTSALEDSPRGPLAKSLRRQGDALSAQLGFVESGTE